MRRETNARAVQLIGIMGCLCFLHCAPALRIAQQTGGAMTAIYKYMAVRISSMRARFCLLALICSRWIGRRSLAMPLSISHRRRLWRYASSKQAFRPFPYTLSARISRYQQWQGPSGLASLDRDPVPLRNTVRPDAALPRCESQALTAVHTVASAALPECRTLPCLGLPSSRRLPLSETAAEAMGAGETSC